MKDTDHSLIPYQDIVQEALRTVVGMTLKMVAENGGNLPGQHHFYISFNTTTAGVDIPARLRERFPEELTIVLQNKFSNLVVDEDEFSVDLTFSGVPANITVPYAAVTAFIDPAVDFSLQFDVSLNEEKDAAEQPAPQRSSDGEDNVVSVDFGKKS